jgi:hypothetical protein
MFLKSKPATLNKKNNKNSMVKIRLKQIAIILFLTVAVVNLLVIFTDRMLTLIGNM